MTKEKSCTIRLLNKSYEIKCPEGEIDNLHRAATKLNESLLKKKTQFKQLDDFQALLLAALRISHQLVICQNQQEKHREHVTQFISSLESTIRQVANTTILQDFSSETTETD